MNHVTRCLVAGLVAVLPIGGLVLSIAWLEGALSESWRGHVPFYFPGMGLLLTLLGLYAVGLVATTFLGRWLWRRLDRMLERLPLMGSLYQSLKEVLGYDSARDKFFEAVVAVRVDGGYEIGLVTGQMRGPDGAPQAIVFVPSSPNPANGRLVLLPAATLERLPIRAADALRGLVSMGKTPFVT
jgi:uncharacterized membrane protein